MVKVGLGYICRCLYMSKKYNKYLYFFISHVKKMSKNKDIIGNVLNC